MKGAPTHPHIEDTVLRAAWLYYRESFNQEQIADVLGVSRATVGRLLERARRDGVVRVEIDPGLLGAVDAASALSQHYGDLEILVVPSDGIEHDQETTNERLALIASQLLMSRLSEGETLAIGWGDTVVKTIAQLPEECAFGEIVTLTGGVPTYLESLSARFGGRLTMIPTPFLASTPGLANAFSEEPDVHRILERALAAEWKMVGIGALTPHASIVRFGHATAEGLEQIEAQGAVGDMLGQFYRADGEVLDLDIHQRRIAVDLKELAQGSGTLIAVAGGAEKQDAMVGALAMGCIDILVTTEEDARALLDRLAGEEDSREGEGHAGG